MKPSHIITLYLLQALLGTTPLWANHGASSQLRGPERTIRDFRGRALAQLCAGAPARRVAAEFSTALRERAHTWLDAALKKHPAPHPAAFVLLGSVARGEALPGVKSSSDIDYAILTGGPHSPSSARWAASVHDELMRSAAREGFELCHKLNGKESRMSPDALLALSAGLFHAGNLFTGQLFGGSREVFDDYLAQREVFTGQKDGDPSSPYSSFRPKHMQFMERSRAWARLTRSKISERIKEIEGGRGDAMLQRDPQFWKHYMTAGSVALQNFAVAADLKAVNTFDRIEEASRRGMLTPKLQREVEAAVAFFLEQKARDKRGAPLASLREVVPHLSAYADVLQAYEALQ